MSESEDDMSSRNISLQLQRLFYELQYSDYSVAPKDLTDSVGWCTNESLKQHDVQELNSILRGAIEEKAKGTLMEGSIQEIFEGHCMSYIDCISVKHTTKIKEPFHDLQLDVRGCRDVYASFDKYVGIERLDGDNKYLTEQHGLQDARKSVRFIDFPPVLQLQLKRFEYDFVSEAMVKIYDRYAFPLELDLDRENGKYLSPDADWKIRNLFTLHRY
ncbi:ubiquitinyl hydrolase 1 [Ranunculus cassubicifolius]